MILSGHQANYLPYPGLFSKIFNSDYFIYVNKVIFTKTKLENDYLVLCLLWVSLLTVNKLG